MVVPKPQLQNDEPAAIESPNIGDYEHPVIQQRNELDKIREGGQSAEDAHELVYGAVDLADTESKGKFASTLSRVQRDSEKRGVKIDKNSEHQSLLAKDAQVEKNVGAVTPQDLKTTKDDEIPDQLETKEEVDYNEFDLMYLQTYGRA